jgi:hypothetical protein
MTEKAKTKIPARERRGNLSLDNLSLVQTKLLKLKCAKYVDQMNFVQQEINGLLLGWLARSICLVCLEHQNREIKTTDGTVWLNWVELRRVTQWTKLFLMVVLFIKVHMISKA